MELLDELADFKHFSEKVKFWKNYKCFDPFCMGKLQFQTSWWGKRGKNFGNLTLVKNIFPRLKEKYFLPVKNIFPSDVEKYFLPMSNFQNFSPFSLTKKFEIVIFPYKMGQNTCNFFKIWLFQKNAWNLPIHREVPKLIISL